MKKTFTYLRTLLVGLMAVTATGNAWADDKTVVKYSFDDATSPSLTAGSRVGFDYDKTSVITSTKFLNAYNNTNGDPGASTVSLGSTDLSGETWTLSFEWAACGGCNSKPDHTTLKAGDTNLFDLTGNSNWNTTVTITYAGSDGTKTLPVPGCDKSKRFSAATGDQLNTTAYWHHIVVTGSSDGVKMTITNSSTGTAVVEDIVLSESNVNPTSLIIEPCCGGAIGIDELLLSYAVEGEVIQTPIAAYTNVNGTKRTITATCDTEGATIQYSLDGETYTDGAEVEVEELGNVYFKAVKGTSESDVLTFAAEAGTEIKLNTPIINRTSNTSVTISADQSNLLLTPDATIYYTYGEESGSFTGSKVLTVAADDVISAYAAYDGYATSETAERAVALWPTTLETIENTPAKTAGWSANAFSDDTRTVSDRTYAALLLDDAQWGTNVYLQTDGAWGLRASGNWYINSNTENSWILMPNMKQGDFILIDVTYPAADMVNATFSKYSYGTKQVYEVTEDGDVELAFKKTSATTMDYIYGAYAYRTVESIPAAITSAGWATLYTSYALDFSSVDGLTAYTATCDGTTVTLTEVTNVPAGTGVVLQGTEGDYNIPVIASSDTDKGDLQGSASESKISNGTQYILTMNGVNAQFAPATAESTIPAGKAYLVVSGGKSRLNVVIAGETTGIKAIEAQEAQEGIYNLQGQRVAKAQKGLYIVNGKKAIVK